MSNNNYQQLEDSNVHQNQQPGGGQLSIDAAMEKVGYKGKYQWLVLFYYLLVYAVSAFTYDFLPYLLQEPTFICEDGETCDEADACGTNFTLAPDQEYSISAKFGLYCDNKKYRTLSESLPYGGVVIGMLVIQYICDNYGRSLSIKVSICIGLVGTCILMFAPSTAMWAIPFGCVLMGFGFQTLNVPIAVHLSEITNGSFRHFAVAAIYIIWGLCQVFVLPISLVAHKYGWILFDVMVAPALVCLVIAQLWVDEPPRFLHLKDKKEQCVKVLNKIARINRRESLDEDELEETYVTNKDSYDVRDLFRYPSQRMKTVWMFIYMLFVHLLFFGTTFSLSSIGKDYAWNRFYIGLTSTCAYSMADYACIRLPRKFLMISTYALANIACFCFYFLDIPEDCQEYEQSCTIKTVQIIMSCFVRGILAFNFSALMLAVNEQYPTTLRSTGYGSAYAVGYIGSAISPYAVQIAKNINLNPLIFLGLINSPGILALFPMEETFKKEPIDEIPEIRRNSMRKASSRMSSKVGESQIGNTQNTTKID